MVKSSDTGGVRPMNISGRYVRERERLHSMTDAERAFRAQWLKDQELAPSEPHIVPELERERYNIFRRLYRAPLDGVEKVLTPSMGAENAYLFRYMSGKILMGIAFAYAATYYFKYNNNDWTKKSGWYVVQNRPVVLPGDAEYPKVSSKTKGSDYAQRGFNNVNLNL